MTKHTFKTLMQRLSRAGFKKDFVRQAILPDWWDDSCSEDPSLLPDLEFRIARFLGMPLATVRDAAAALTPPAYPGAQLRRVRAVDRDRLGPAIHSAMRIAGAVIRSLREPARDLVVPPSDALVWRELIHRAQPAVGLGDLLNDLWQRGIPVIPLEVLPSPSFEGIACIVEGRPVIVLGHKLDEPGRVAWIVAHETGHIARGDCTPGQPVVDEEGEIADDSEIERRAERFAARVLLGGEGAPVMEATGLQQLTGQSLRQCFDQHVDLDAASESDRALLRCVHGDPERNESSR